MQRLRGEGTRTISGPDFYSRIWANQGGTGSAFRWIDRIWQGPDEALCHVARPATIAASAAQRLHPGMVEAACQLLHACGVIETEANLEHNGVTYVPFSVDRLTVLDPASARAGVWCHARMRSLAELEVVGDLSIADQAGRLLVSIEGFRLRRIYRLALTVQSAAATPVAAPIAAHIAAQIAGAGADINQSAPALPGSLKNPPEGGARSESSLDYVLRQCAAISGYATTELTPTASFIELGMDSVMAVMLVNRIRRDLGATIDVSAVLTSPSLAALADAITGTRILETRA